MVLTSKYAINNSNCLQNEKFDREMQVSTSSRLVIGYSDYSTAGFCISLDKLKSDLRKWQMNGYYNIGGLDHSGYCSSEIYMYNPYSEV